MDVGRLLVGEPSVQCQRDHKKYANLAETLVYYTSSMENTLITQLGIFHAQCCCSDCFAAVHSLACTTPTLHT